VAEIRSQLDHSIQALEGSSEVCVKELEFLFAPTGPLQETAMSNDWSEEYLSLASQFDALIGKNVDSATRPTHRLADSPWFWLCLFASAAVLALIAIGPKYRQREARLETQLRMRDHLVRGEQSIASSKGDSEPAVATEDDLIRSTEPLIWILSGAVAVGWGLLFWSRRTGANRVSANDAGRVS
jgi:hypothetical protein